MNDFRPISILVMNEPGVLARVAGLFARRGYNITSLAVGHTDDPKVSRISVMVRANSSTLEQVVKQLRRLVSVIDVTDLSDSSRVERGLALIKISVTQNQRNDVVQLANIFRARIDHVDAESVIIEISGNRDKVEAMVDMLRPYGILEMARTGQIVLSRQSMLKVNDLADQAESLSDLAEAEADVYV